MTTFEGLERLPRGSEGGIQGIPDEAGRDHTLALLREGYEFVTNRCRQYDTSIFRTRLMLQPILCLQGVAGAELVYTSEHLTRVGAAPPTVQKLLQGKGSVQGLEGASHRDRKAMFLAMMTPERRLALVHAMEEEWLRRLHEWSIRGEVRLFDEMQEILCKAVCTWAGVPLKGGELPWATRLLSAMIEGAGSVGPRNWRGLLLRMRADRWIDGVIRAIRAGELTVPEDSAAHIVAFHRDADGKQLDTRIATIELVNVLRPTVAVARYIVFVAMALHEFPEWRDRLHKADDGRLERFEHEVRRYYPFFPFVGAKAKEDFVWQGHAFERGTRFLLDLYGTNRDPACWDDAETFRPERFDDGEDPAAFVPQGAADRTTGHRCPGEWVTADLMQAATRLFVDKIGYEVPPQDLGMPLTRVPAIPRSHFVISDVRRLA